MGKIPHFTDKQTIVLDAVSCDPYIATHGYFTGGTALASYYLEHRESEDIDIFSRDPWDPQNVLPILTSIVTKKGGRITTRLVDPVHIYMLHFGDGTSLKVDFAHYPYGLMEQSGLSYNTLRVDSKLDIAINKLLSITQRSEVKDYVDSYFLLKDFTFWDLKMGVAQKFHVDIDPGLIPQDFLGVEEFDHLPTMLKPLSLNDLKKFFREEAVKIAKTVVE